VSDATDKPGVDPQTIPYPEYLTVEKPPYNPRVMRVAVDRYFKQEYHDLEVERIWKKSWQWACREEEIPEIGDHMIYEVANLSFIVVRTGEREFKAYWNSCLHRGRKIRDYGGKRATELRCMFHGWTWNIDGTMKEMTCGWDFPGTREEVTRLPEARTGVWGGFVFINPDPECESLDSFLGELPQHFEQGGHDFSKRWKQVHVIADLPVNWKVAQEAFIEAWHVISTHPQIVRPPSDRAVVGNRWDNFGNWMRSAPALPTDQNKSPPGWGTQAKTAQQVINQHWDYHLNEEPEVNAQEDRPVMQTISARIRELYRISIGDKIDHHHDIHLFGGEMVHVWPNFHPWGGFSRLVYRFRPYKNDPERSLMDVVLLAPWPEDRPRPAPAPIHQLGPDEPISNAPELGQLARIFTQDIGNMPKVQEGLKASRQGYVILSEHNEAPVRHLHDLYNRWMGFEDGDYLASENAK
jgi:phenylpropionate dioxygenase-like ring-hydroxylating dioxygenase large terminal subunit